MLVQRQLPDALLGHSHSRLGHRLYSDFSDISDVSRCLKMWYLTPFGAATDTSDNGTVLMSHRVMCERARVAPATGRGVGIPPGVSKFEKENSVPNA